MGRTVLLSAQRSQSPMAFLYRRLSRIYLGYWPALVAYVAIGYFAFDRLLPTGDTAFKSIFLLIPTIKRNVLPTAWSLTCEIYFYFFAVIAYFYLRRYRTTVLTIAFIALAIWNIGWLTLDKAAVVSGGQPFRFLLSGFCLEFLCGLFLGHIRVPGSVNYRLKFTVIIVGCLGLYAGIFVEFSDRIEIIRVATFGVFAAGCCFWALVPSPPPPAVTRKIPVGVDRRFVV